MADESSPALNAAGDSLAFANSACAEKCSVPSSAAKAACWLLPGGWMLVGTGIAPAVPTKANTVARLSVRSKG